MNEPLTKEKKPRTEAQIQATARMRDALEKKRLTPTEKKLRLKAIKDQLNGITPNKDIDEEPMEDVPKEILEQKPKKNLKNVPPPAPAPTMSKPEPKVIYESGSEQSEEIIVVKKKKKPKKKTIIYEESESEEEQVIKPQTRETKSQKNAKSKFKISTPEPAPICYFE